VPVVASSSAALIPMMFRMLRSLSGPAGGNAGQT